MKTINQETNLSLCESSETMSLSKKIKVMINELVSNNTKEVKAIISAWLISVASNSYAQENQNTEKVWANTFPTEQVEGESVVLTISEKLNIPEELINDINTQIRNSVEWQKWAITIIKWSSDIQFIDRNYKTEAGQYWEFFTELLDNGSANDTYKEKVFSEIYQFPQEFTNENVWEFLANIKTPANDNWKSRISEMSEENPDNLSRLVKWLNTLRDVFPAERIKENKVDSRFDTVPTTFTSFASIARNAYEPYSKTINTDALSSDISYVADILWIDVSRVRVILSDSYYSDRWMDKPQENWSFTYISTEEAERVLNEIKKMVWIDDWASSKEAVANLEEGLLKVEEILWSKWYIKILNKLSDSSKIWVVNIFNNSNNPSDKKLMEELLKDAVSFYRSYEVAIAKRSEDRSYTVNLYQKLEPVIKNVKDWTISNEIISFSYNIDKSDSEYWKNVDNANSILNTLNSSSNS